MDSIGSYMSVPVHSVDINATIRETAQEMQAKNIGSVLIKSNDEYVGIVTETDLARKVLGSGLKPETTKVSEVMTQPVYSMDGFEPVESANKFMAQHKIRHLAVTDEGKIVGMLSVRDLVSFYANPRLRDSEQDKSAKPHSPFRTRHMSKN